MPLSGRLLHRDHELAAAAEALAGVMDARPAVVLIRGVRGIGKTALMRAAVDRGPMDAVVLRARCHDDERGFDLAVVRQLFDPVLQAAGGRLTPGLFAEEAHRAASAAYDRADGADPGTHDLMRALFQVARSLAAAKPVVVSIDDLTSADPMSVRWFSYLARRIEGLPVVLIATADAEGEEDLEHRLHGLPYFRLIQPGPLCPTCSADFVADRLKAPLDHELAVLCHTLSLGNPQVLADLATRLAACEVPPGAPEADTVLRVGAETLSATTLAWLADRYPVTMELLTYLAVLEPDAGLPTAAAVAGHGEFEVDHARDVLRRAGLITASGPDTIRDGMIRTAVLSRLDVAGRLEIHQRAADLLTRLGAPPLAVARHLMSLGSVHGTPQLRILREAAQEAAASGRLDLAAGLLRRALADAAGPEQTRELTGRLGKVEQHRDVAAFHRLAETVSATADGPATRAQALLPFLSPVLVANSSSLSRTLTDTARTLEVREATPRHLLLSFGAAAMLSAHRTDHRRVLRTLINRPAGEAARQDVEYLGALAVAAAADGRHRRAARRLAHRCLAAAGPAATDVRVVGAVLALSWSGEPDPALSAADRMTETIKALKHDGEHALALLIRSDLRYRRGQWLPALVDADQAALLADTVNARGLLAAAQAAAARAAIRLGDLDGARCRLSGPGPADLHPLGWGVVLQARGMLAAADGDHAEALRAFLECGHQLSVHGMANQNCIPWRAHAAEQYRAQGETAAARTIVTPPAGGGAAGSGNGAGADGGDAASERRGPGNRAVHLTYAEQRVVDLVRQGLSNAEAAERLYLSKRTVDTHLGRIYRRLGIGGRAELAALFEPPPDDEGREREGRDGERSADT